MLNSVHLIGRLGRDPELRYTPSGTPIGNLRIATDESYTASDGNKVDRVEWHTVVVFNKPAEACANYLGKGSLVFVEGSLQTRKWQDQNGQDRYSTEIKAQRVQFLDRKVDHQPANEPATGNVNTGASAVSRTARMPELQPARAASRQTPQNDPYGGMDDDLGPDFPSEASGMDDVPF